MALDKQYLRRTVAGRAGDLIIVAATADGEVDGSTIVCSSLNGRQDDADLGKWAVVTFAQDPDADPPTADVRFAYISDSLGPPKDGNPTDYTLYLVPPLGAQVTTGMLVEIMAYRPDWYTGAINDACQNVFPWLYAPLYNATLNNLDPATFRYDLPGGVDANDVTRVMMTGLPNTPFAGVPYYEVADYSFLPTGTAGATQLVLNRLGNPFAVSPTTGCALVLMGWGHLTGVTPDGDSLAHPMYRIQDDIVPGPELSQGGEYDVLLREFILAYLFRTMMTAPSTPDRAGFATMFTAQMQYATQQATQHLMPRVERRRAQ